ncbi:MAG: ORF6C domain-containing protein [Peptococcaceae bacterium]|nr:ORF6C domain-containing protein [Peptococcaceae bacterium]
MSTELAVGRDRQILAALRQVMEIHTNRLDSLDGRVTQIENVIDREVLITNRQASALGFAKRKRVRELLQDPEQYKALASKYFSAINREIWARFAVASYRDIPRKEFAAAMKLIDEWFPARPIQ